MAPSFWTKILNTTQLRPDYSHPPSGLKWRSNTFFIISTVTVGLFTDLFLYCILVPVLPFMLEDRAGVPESETQSYVSIMLAAYAGASFFFSPVAGVLADKVSTRQAPFLLGLAALLGATTLLFLGRSVGVLIIARVLQGMSSAVVWSIGMAMAVETVGGENFGKTVGTMFAFISAGVFWAPFFGGTLYEKAGYTGVIGVSFAVIALDFIMRVFVIEKKVAKRYGLDDSKPDETTTNSSNQSGDGTDSERQPLLGQTEDDEEDFKLPAEKPWVAKIMPILPLLSNLRLITALILTLVSALSIGSFDATVPIVSRELFGFDSLQAGLLFLPLGVMDLIVGPVTGWSVDRFGTKPASVISFAAMVPIFVALRFPHAGGTDQIALYVVLLALTGCAISGQGSPAIVEAGTIVGKYHEKNKEYFGENGPYAQLYALNSMVYNLGLVVGPELAGELKTAIGYGNMNAVLAVVSGITAVLGWVYIGGKPKVLSRKK